MAKALVVVDMLNDFVRQDEDYKGKLAVDGAKYLIENIGKIRGAAGEQNVLVIYANDAHIKDDPEFRLWPEHAVKGDYGADVIDELMPQEGDLVIEKQDLGMFTNKQADKLLKAKNIDELYVTGVATEYCVRAAVLGAADLGYKINVVVDAVAGVDINQGDQYKALIEMGNAGAIPIKTKQVLEEIVR